MNLRTVVKLLAVAVFLHGSGLHAQDREANVVYGMYSGLALLMDVYHPDVPQGRAVILVQGSGYTSPLGYDANQLKEGPRGLESWVAPLTEAGYTVFSINHRQTPRFSYPAPVEDVQRAVRFVRHHAARFGIDPDRIGGMGHSSGASLITLVAMLGASGDESAEDPVEREDATIQALISRSGAVNFMRSPSPHLILFLNSVNGSFREEVSPLSHVGPSSPPTLFIHGDADRINALEHSVDMHEALLGMEVPSDLIIVPRGGHDPEFGGAAVGAGVHPDFSTYVSAAVAWYDQHLAVSR